MDIAAVGRSRTPVLRQWENRDTLLYALSVGAGSEDLPFVTENSFRQPRYVLPTFGVVVCDITRAVPLLGGVDVSRLLHGSHSLSASRGLDQSGELRVTAEIANIYDKGAGGHALIDVVSRGIDPKDGAVVVECTARLVLRGAGGFGGEAPPPAAGTITDPSVVDIVVEDATRSEQALFYRLTGDRNPLHSDPAFARRAGFDRPILHGLCSYGFAGRALLDSCCESDPARFRSMECRFSSPVFPGEYLRTSIHVVSDGTAFFRTEASPDRSSYRVVLTDGIFSYLDASSSDSASLA